MTLKRIDVEFHSPDAQRRFRSFSGWVYYMVHNDQYNFYEIIPDKKDHRLLASVKRSDVKEITERILL